MSAPVIPGRGLPVIHLDGVPRARLRQPRLLAETLERLGVAERECARRAGLSHSTVNHLVTGRRKDCLLTTADAIERALNLPLRTLFQERTT